MAVTYEDITALGFTPSMYSIDETTLKSRIEAVISEQSDEVKERVGESAFSLADNADAVDRAVRYKAAAEMARRRIVALSANTMADQAEGTEATHLERLIDRWEARAEKWIGRIVDGGLSDSGGFATGCLVSESDNRMTYPES